MIGRLEGVLRERTPTRVILDVGGVGYDVSIPFSTFGALPDEGKTVALRIHTHMREGSIQLFGFASAGEHAAFELLLRANRVGPKLAQTVLSGIAPDELLVAIRDGHTALLRGVPGVGPKMAERLLVELRDRAEELALVLSAAGGAPSTVSGTPVDPVADAREQALSALLNLGYPKAQAERVLAEVAREGEPGDVEAYVRGALKRLAR